MRLFPRATLVNNASVVAVVVELGAKVAEGFSGKECNGK